MDDDDENDNDSDHDKKMKEKKDNTVNNGETFSLTTIMIIKSYSMHTPVLGE